MPDSKKLKTKLSRTGSVLEDFMDMNYDIEDGGTSEDTKADIRLALIGKIGVGKSETANTLTGRDVFRSSAMASSVTQECQCQVVRRVGRILQVVDSPGLGDTADDIRRNTTDLITLSSPGPHAILLLVRLGRFTEEDRNTIEEMKKWFGPEVCKYFIICFTGKDGLEEEGITLTDFISTSPKYLQDLLSVANGRYLAVNNRACEEEKLRFTQELLVIVDEMVKTNKQNWYTMEMYQEAEQSVKQEDDEERQMRESQLKRKRDEIEESVKAKYAKMMREQIEKIEIIRHEILNLQQQERDTTEQYRDRMTELKLRLVDSRTEREEGERRRSRWVESSVVQFNLNEAKRRSDLTAFESRINQDIHQKETKLKALQKQIEDAQNTRTRELNRENERKRLEEEHKRRIAALEAQRQEEQEVLKQQKLAHAQSESDLFRLMEVERSRQRRNSCTMS